MNLSSNRYETKAIGSELLLVRCDAFNPFRTGNIYANRHTVICSTGPLPVKYFSLRFSSNYEANATGNCYDCINSVVFIICQLLPVMRKHTFRDCFRNYEAVEDLSLFHISLCMQYRGYFSSEANTFEFIENVFKSVIINIYITFSFKITQSAVLVFVYESQMKHTFKKHFFNIPMKS